MEQEIPAPSELAAELAGMVAGGVTIDALRGCQVIPGLPVVRAKSARDDMADLAVAAHTLIREAARRVDDADAYGPVSTLLGVAPGSRGTLIKERRKRVAELLHVSAEHVRKDREDTLIEAVADELYGLDSAYRLRHRHREEAEREPQDSRLGINWLEQHRSYRRIWTPVSGMRNDLAVLRECLAADKEDRDAISDRLANITWQWARFEMALQRFVREQGGLWLLADVDSEVAAAEAVYKLTYYVPLGETDSSWLRTMLAEAPHEELDGFGDLLVAAGERRRELMELWIQWASCPKSDEADCGCGFHYWERAADEFIRLVDEDWYAVADWYRLSGEQADAHGD